MRTVRYSRRGARHAGRKYEIFGRMKKIRGDVSGLLRFSI